MARKKHIDPNQLDFSALFEVPDVPENDEVGGMDIDYELRLSLNVAIKEYKKSTGKDRFALAAELSRVTDTEVTKNSLDSWTAPSRTEWRFPLHLFPAFINVTGAKWLLNDLAMKCGCMVMSHDDAKAARYGKLKKLKEQLDKELKQAEKAMKAEDLL